MKLLATFLVLVFTFFVTPNVLAKEENSLSRSLPRKEEKVDNIKNRVSTIRKNRLMSFSNQMISRLESTEVRIKNLLDRISTRVAKIKSSDKQIDVTKAENTISEANIKLLSVDSKIKDLKINLDSMSVSETPKDFMVKIKTSLNTIKNDLKEIHLLLVKSIGDIKGLRVGDNKNNEK